MDIYIIGKTSTGTNLFATEPAHDAYKVVVSNELLRVCGVLR